MSHPNRRTVLKGIAAGGASLGFASPVGAKREKCKLNWRKELSQRKPSGSPVVNATQEVVNDIDHGRNGFWAYLDYRRTLQAWEVDDAFEAVVTYKGQFDGVEDALSYTQAETLTGVEEGTIHGGYAATIEGSLLDDPEWPTHGFVGTTDYDGVIEDRDSDPELEGERRNAIPWQDQYFDVSDFTFDWWGWIYRSGNCGTLVAAIDGRCGDIVCD